MYMGIFCVGSKFQVQNSQVLHKNLKVGKSDSCAIICLICRLSSSAFLPVHRVEHVFRNSAPSSRRKIILVGDEAYKLSGPFYSELSTILKRPNKTYVLRAEQFRGNLVDEQQVCMGALRKVFDGRVTSSANLEFTKTSSQVLSHFYPYSPRVLQVEVNM